jgi:vacuolar-type H+-ATPase subunit I/STV1
MKKIKIIINKIKNKIKNKINMRKLKIGDKVKVLDNSSGANYAIGSVGVIVQITECSRTLVLEDVKTKIRGNFIQEHDVKLYELSEQEIQEEISSLNEQIKEKENMLKWMKETNNETFNEEERSYIENERHYAFLKKFGLRPTKRRNFAECYKSEDGGDM